MVFGDGSQVYDFIHVADMARANMLGDEGRLRRRELQRRHGLGTSINELVQMLLELTGSTLTPRVPAAGAELRDAPHRQHRQGRARCSASGHDPLREGLQSVVDWRMAQLGVQA